MLRRELSPNPAAAADSSELQVGDRVSVLFTQPRKEFPGSVTQRLSQHTVKVLFDDGDHLTVDPRQNRVIVLVAVGGGNRGPLQRGVESDEVNEAAGTEVSGGDTVCAVCLEKFGGMTSDTCLYTLKCGHVFCDGCIEHWFQERKSCPNCRRGFPSLRLCPRVTVREWLALGSERHQVAGLVANHSGQVTDNLDAARPPKRRRGCTSKAQVVASTPHKRAKGAGQTTSNAILQQADAPAQRRAAGTAAQQAARVADGERIALNSGGGNGSGRRKARDWTEAELTKLVDLVKIHGR